MATKPLMWQFRDLSHCSARCRAAGDGSKTGCDPCRRSSREVTPSARAKISIRLAVTFGAERLSTIPAGQSVRSTNRPATGPIRRADPGSPSAVTKELCSNNSRYDAEWRTRSVRQYALKAPGGPKSSSRDPRSLPLPGPLAMTMPVVLTPGILAAPQPIPPVPSQYQQPLR